MTATKQNNKVHKISGSGGVKKSGAEGESGWNVERRRGGKKKFVLSKTQSQRSLEYDKLNK